MVLGSMMVLVMAFVSAAIRVGAIGYVDGLANLSGRSVLSEFNCHLKDDYGLFAFRGHRQELIDKLSGYMSYTLDKNRFMNLESVDANTAGYSLADVDIFESELCEYTKFAIARGWIPDALSPDGEGEGQIVDKDKQGRTLRNHKVIDVLPSGGKPGKSGIVTGFEVPEAKGTTNYLITQYVMKTFSNAQKHTGKHGFFDNEVEYIIEGNMSDYENKKEMRKDIKKLRNEINFLFIWTNGKMRSEVMAAAELLGLGIGAPLVAAAIAEAWALAESENDMKLLEHGRRVPMFKTTDTWAVDIQSVITSGEPGFIDNHSRTGLTYQGYLQLFLFKEERSLKLGRIMDLMQINIVGKYDSSFLIKEHNMGMWMKVRVDGREYSYDQKY